jgi:hypothetical protein
MFGSKKLKLIGSLLSLIMVAACAQPTPAPTANVVSALPPGAPTPVVVRILNLDLTLVASPTPALPTSTPLLTLAPRPTLDQVSAGSPTVTTSTPVCTNKAEFIKYLAVSNNTAFKPDQLFATIWQIKNTGTCVWSSEYSLVYASGESMGSQASIPLPHPVNPGEVVDIQLNLVSPGIPNTYTGNWYLQDESGTVFGLGEDGVQPLSLTIVVRPVPKPPI